MIVNLEIAMLLKVRFALAVAALVATCVSASGEDIERRKATLDYLFEAATAMENRAAWPNGKAAGKWIRKTMYADGGIVEDLSIKFKIEWDKDRSFRELWTVDYKDAAKMKNPARDAGEVFVGCKRILLNENGAITALGLVETGASRIVGAQVVPAKATSPLRHSESVAPFEEPLLYPGGLKVSLVVDFYRKQAAQPEPRIKTEVVEQDSMIVLRIKTADGQKIGQVLQFDKSFGGRLVKYEEWPNPVISIAGTGEMEWDRDKHGFIYLKSHHFQRRMSDPPQRVIEDMRFEITEYDSAPELDARSFHEDRLEIPKGTQVTIVSVDPTAPSKATVWGVEDQSIGAKSIDDLVRRLRSRGFSAAARDQTK